MNARLTFIQALSSLHPGTGQGAGVIDLPVAREAATGIPYLPGSSLKGVLRDQCGDDAQCEQLFGPKSDSITNANVSYINSEFTLSSACNSMWTHTEL